MTALIIVLSVMAALLLLYILAGRDWLKAQSWTGSFFTWIEPIEIALWRKSETLLWSRLLMIMGVLPPILQQAESFMGIPGILDILPEKYQGPWTLSFTVIGVINEILRRTTTLPLSQVAKRDEDK